LIFFTVRYCISGVHC